MEDQCTPHAVKLASGSSQPWVSRVFIIDDHRFFTFALRSLINTQADLTVCGVGHDETTAIEGIICTNPDIVVLDLRLNTLGGVDVAATVRRFSKLTPILFVSSMQNPSLAQESKWLEPCSFVEKTQDPVDIISGIRQAFAKHRLFQSLSQTNSHTLKK